MPGIAVAVQHHMLSLYYFKLAGTARYGNTPREGVAYTAAGNTDCNVGYGKCKARLLPPGLPTMHVSAVGFTVASQLAWQPHQSLAARQPSLCQLLQAAAPAAAVAERCGAPWVGHPAGTVQRRVSPYGSGAGVLPSELQC